MAIRYDMCCGNTGSVACLCGGLGRIGLQVGVGDIDMSDALDLSITDTVASVTRRTGYRPYTADEFRATDIFWLRHKRSGDLRDVVRVEAKGLFELADGII